MDWLQEEGICLTRQHEHTDGCYRNNIAGRTLVCEAWVEKEPLHEPYERLFERFFGLDRKRLDQEQDALLAYQRALNEAHGV